MRLRLKATATNIAGDGVPHNASPLDQDYALIINNGSEGNSTLNLISAASRLTHGPAGVFEIAMPTSGVSGVECRSASTYNAVFTFDGPVSSGNVSVLSGTAIVGTVTASGSTLIAPLTGVTNPQVLNPAGVEH